MEWKFLNVPVPGWIYRGLRAVRDRLSQDKINLLGDRDIEWSFVSAHIPQGPGQALDFGPGGSALGLIAAQKGFHVTALDREDVQWNYFHYGLEFQRGDLLNASLPENHFDLVINCSTVEHVGLAGRYGVDKNETDGDLEAMKRLRDSMKPEAVMLLTIPLGEDAVFAPFCRVYGRQRLPKLLDGFRVEKEQFWVKDAANRWELAEKQKALQFKASMGSWSVMRNVCALGCFVLRKTENEKTEKENAR